MRLGFAALCLAQLALAGCTTGAKPAADEGRRIRVFYNNDNFAYLETCGCRVSPIGGMDRRWNAMKAYPDDTRVFLDAGNLLFKSATASEFLAPQWYEQASGVIEAYNLLGADAVEVGETEFALGVAKFRELAAQAKFPFISANLFEKAGGKPFLRDSVMLHRQGKKIGVFGLFGRGLQLPPELEARDPIAAAKTMVERLRKDGADMVIALTHEGYDADVQLARRVPGIDLIVGGHSQSLLQHPYEEGKTLLVQLSNEGQMLGMVEYAAADLPRTRTGFVVAELNNEFDEGPKGLANPMKNLVAVTNLRIQETNRALDQKIWADQAKRLPAGGFETFLSCRDCHAKQADFHLGKAHSAAFLTLMQKHKERNLDCVKCHSVGLGQTGGFESMADAFRDASGQPVPLDKIRQAAGAGFPKNDVSYRDNLHRARADAERWTASLLKAGVRKAFVGVQCENCHGALPGHPFRDVHPTAVRITSCVQCHTPEQAPGWYGKDGNLLEDKAQAALESMRCPR
jgi:hypothetical protein